MMSREASLEQVLLSSPPSTWDAALPHLHARGGREWSYIEHEVRARFPAKWDETAPARRATVEEELALVRAEVCAMLLATMREIGPYMVTAFIIDGPTLA